VQQGTSLALLAPHQPLLQEMQQQRHQRLLQEMQQQ
jgi:hypothetical protein